MAVDVGYLSAVGAGAISFLSPCVLPLVPPYLCYMAGVTVEDFRENSEEAARPGARIALVIASVAFRLVFPFLAAGVFSGAFMRFMTKFRVHLGRVEKAIGGLLVLAGIFFVTGGVKTASYWLLEMFPALGQLG